MQVYKSKCGKIPGTSYGEVYPTAWKLYKTITATTKRQPYVRATYFARDKVFLNYFWQHLRQKGYKDRTRRIKFFHAALDLIHNTTCKPTTMQDLNNRNVLLHRFIGSTRENELFYVQIKETKSTQRKDFISVFPVE